MTKYHAVGSDWSEGEDICSFDELEALGCPVEWKWEGEAVDADAVSVTDTLAEAKRIAGDFSLTRVLAIDWDIVSEERVTGTNSEGYSIAYGHIPAEAIIEIITI